MTEHVPNQVSAGALDLHGDSLGDGGQGRIYRVTAIGGRPPDQPLVYKCYKSQWLAAVDAAALRDLVQFPELLDAATRRRLVERTAWPAAAVMADRHAVGLLMPLIPDEFRRPLHLPGVGRDEYCQVQHLLNADSYLDLVRLPVDDRWRLDFLADLADTIALLHRHGLVVGDLSPLNIYPRFGSAPQCFFVDCDAMAANGRSVLPQAQTRGWEAPSGEATASPHTDAYKFALLATRLFAGDQDTRNPAALTRCSPVLGTLARDGLGPPQARPKPSLWALTLRAATPDTLRLRGRVRPAGTVMAGTSGTGRPVPAAAAAKPVRAPTPAPTAAAPAAAPAAPAPARPVPAPARPSPVMPSPAPSPAPPAPAPAPPAGSRPPPQAGRAGPAVHRWRARRPSLPGSIERRSPGRPRMSRARPAGWPATRRRPARGWLHFPPTHPGSHPAAMAGTARPGPAWLGRGGAGRWLNRTGGRQLSRQRPITLAVVLLLLAMVSLYSTGRLIAGASRLPTDGPNSPPPPTTWTGNIYKAEGEVNLRKDPGKDYPPVHKYRAGQPITVLCVAHGGWWEDTTGEPSGDTWYRVSSPHGYVATGYVDVHGATVRSCG